MNTIAWLIPRLVLGSGGIRTMLQHAHALVAVGYNCCLYIEGVGSDSRAANEVQRMFGFRFENVFYGWDAIDRADLVIATIWYSAPIVSNITFDCAKAYLVQDYEAMFYPAGYEHMMAENSYKLGLIPISVGNWLRHLLIKRYDSLSYSLNFSVDTHVYRSLSNPPPERAVCFIHQPDKPRRSSRLGIDALGVLKHYAPDVKIYLYGSPVEDARNIWFDCENLGLLDVQSCNELYNRCSVGLCLSSSNPSRVPFEMMAAGLPVVELWRENCFFDFSPDGVSLTDQTPESLAFNILRIIDDPSLRKRMSAAGSADAISRAKHSESGQFVVAVQSIISGHPAPLEEVKATYTLDVVTAPSKFIKSVPLDLKKRIYQPSNARLNALPSGVRKILGWGAKKVRAYLID